MLAYCLLLLSQLFFSIVSASQAAFSTPQYVPQLLSAYDDGLFTPMEDMNILSETEFTVLSHPVFPQYNVRIKKSTFCDPTVKAYTGYIDIEARHIFFYFFESRNDPDKDDVIFWTNGGPGCSSSLGLFMELGPCRISDGNGTSFHPESWNTNSNIFFVDQPVGVGFSHADWGESVGTTEEGAKDIAAFIFVFFEHFSKFKGRGLHMTGESYGGRYVPVFAAEIYDQNTRLAAAGYTPINLTSVMIGNGITDFYHQMSSSFDMQCTAASVPPTLGIADCVRIKAMIPRCEQRLKESCVDHFDAIDCAAAASFCDVHLRAPFWKSELNPYDISQPCDAEGMATNLCYPVTAHIRAYLSRPDVREALGVDPTVAANFSSCSPAVGSAFHAQMDSYRPTQDYVGGLLERGVRVLIYVGTYDWICNWVGNERWTLALEWSGQAAFAAEPLRPWAIGDDFTKGRAGLARSAQGLTFATVDKAGHMVPYDKPKEALDLLQRWLSGKGFLV
ncbi:serine carboxypeptidase [Mycena metata]|uniref:Carboxypeptidase n=1 Tax=Mycena metata TaxID=1033252 RepID=A0AAD7JKM4_9AGAR|nr:serine carboxypeptidase [Mycena metata]